MQIMYGIWGQRRLLEWEATWLPGYEGARPVRIGNAAHAQLQLDVYGELIDVLWQSTRAGVKPSQDVWSLGTLLLDTLEDRWHEPDEGIWEVRGGRRHFTFSKVMCWVAFDRAVSMVEQAGYPGPVDHWRALRDEIHRDVCEHGFNRDVGAFVQSYGSDRLDASVLMIPLVGFLPGVDARVKSTIDAIERDLTNDGFVMRYDPTNEDLDGIGEREGVFLPCSFWMVEALALADRHADACALFDRLLGVANDVGLLAEEYDPEARRLVGNFPQAFTHLALVAAAHTLQPAAADVTRRRHR
jgi:GH15 family glucan-1,4-alpha-glucosidase